MTTVVHCKREPFDIYIGRPSKWGNPFAIGKDGTREEVIEKYRQYIQQRPELMSALPELKGKRLGCWCKPKACHGDVLAELAEAAKEATKKMKRCECCGGTKQLIAPFGSKIFPCTECDENGEVETI